MMRLRSRTSPDDELSDEKSQPRRPERTGVPLKAQKLLGEKGHLGFNLEESIIISGGGPHAGGIDVPPKAQKVLGERAKVREVRVQEARHADPDSFWYVRDAERQKSAGNSDRTSHADSDTVSGAAKGTPLPHLPVALTSSEDVRPSSNGSTLPTVTSSWNTHHQHSVESLDRDYYDPTKQPLIVSQQTSESSVRDMALRKGGTQIYDSSSETRLTTPQSRDSSTRQALPDRSVSDGAPRQHKKIGLRSLLPHSKSDARAGGGKFARPPPSSSPASSESLSRKGAKISRLGPRQSSEPNHGKPNKFSTDVYDNRKTNVRRPPKGIKNWFDGFDISSDEDEETDAVELPAGESSKTQISTAQGALPSVFSLYGTPARDFEAPTYVNPSVFPARSSSLVNDKRPVSKHQNKRKNSQSSATAESASSGAVDGRKRSGESRLARSRLEAQSVLSLSSGSDEKTIPRANRDSVGNSTIVNGRANSFDLHRVATPNGGEGHQDSIEQASSDAKIRRSNSHSSGLRSNPFRDSSTNYNSTPVVPSRESGSMLSGSSSNAKRWQYGWNGLSYRRSNVHTPYERDGGESAGGETSSSVPTDASRLMAVTEEEMILLELMRQKRAAMQKHSFAEGYRLARRQGEQFHYNPVQNPASDPSHLVFRKRGGSRMTNRGMSRTESLIREEIEQRKRLSALRKEEVDKAFKIGRFLEMDSPSEASSSKMDRFLVTAPGMASDFSGRPISGTEIEIDSRYGDNEDVGEELQSNFDEEEVFEDHPMGREEDTEPSTNQSDTERGEEVQENRTPQPVISPMQRLTNQVRAVSNDGTSAKAPASKAANGGADVAGTVPSLGSPPRGEIGGNEKSIAEASGAEIQAHAIAASNPKFRGGSSLQVKSQGLEYDALQEPEIDSPDTPVATTWARPTSLKHPRPQRQQPALDFAPLEYDHLRSEVPPVSVNQTSSLRRQSFDRTAQPSAGRSRATEDVRASIPQNGSHEIDPDAPDPLGSHPLNGVTRPKRVPAPPRLDTTGQGGDARVTSMASITSAGEDVLAAWAELGGSELRRKRDW